MRRLSPSNQKIKAGRIGGGDTRCVRATMVRGRRGRPFYLDILEVWGFGTRRMLTLSVVRVRPCVLLRLWCYWYIAP